MQRFPRPSVAFRFTLALVAFLALPACSINVKKADNGEDKKIDIETPIAGIHVSKGADVRDTGLPVYPGARQKDLDKPGEQKSANLNISAGFFGLKVVAIEYRSDDPPEKVAAYYKDQLKKYGTILECHTSGRHGDVGDVDVHIGKDSDRVEKDSQKLRCEHESGTTLELKVGTRDNQHLVSISPEDQGKGTDFALVFVQTRGGDKDTI